MIKLKNIILEQSVIGAPNRGVINSPALKALKKPETVAYKIAKTIYDAKGYIWDDEAAAIAAVKSIKSEFQLEQVEQELVKLTDGRGIGEYLVSFLEDFNQNKTVLDHLINISSPISTTWTVHPYGDLVFKEYRSNFMNQNNTVIKPEFRKYLSDELQKRIRGGVSYKDFAPIKMLTMMPHEILYAMSWAFSFVPVVGVWIGSGIMLLDSYLYYKEGNKTTATFYAAFAMLPFVGKIANRIPIVKQTSSKTMQFIANKILKRKKLTPKEIVIVNEINKNKTLIQSELNNVFSTINELYLDKTINKWLKTLTPQEISVIRTNVLNGTYKFSDLQKLTSWLSTQSPSAKTAVFDMLNSGNLSLKTIIEIDQAVLDKSIRMLSQEKKFLDAGAAERYRMFLNRTRGIEINKVNPSLGTASSKTATASVGLSKSLDKPLTIKQIKYIASHELDHMYRNTAKEGAEWAKAFDFNKLDSHTRRYFQAIEKNPNDVPQFVKAPTVKNDPFGLTTSARYNTYDEIRARAGQLKDYIAMKRGIPLSQDFKVTMSDLNYAINNYIKDVGLDNNMSAFFKALTDKNILLKNMNKYALGTAGLISIGALNTTPDVNEHQIKLKSLL